MKKTITKYLPDIIIIGGILMLSYNLLRHETIGNLPSLVNYHTEYKVFGIVLIAIGVDMAIRKYINSRVGKK